MKMEIQERDCLKTHNSLNRLRTVLFITVHFPEGPLYHDAPRPDSTDNKFCLVCHAGNSNEKIKELTVDALRFRNVQAKLDPRHQQ